MPTRRPALSYGLLVGLLAALGLGAGGAWAEPPVAPPATAEERARLAFEALASPLLRERREAAREIIGLLPGARARVAAAWAGGDEGLRSALTEVLAAESSLEFLALLLEAWRTGGDALASRARSALLRNPPASRRALEDALARPPPPGPPARRPLEALVTMLDRDEVEQLFLARKSRSGGTGFYRGQYESLLPRRELALEVCYHIVVDRALRLPGTSSVGGYRFLRAPSKVLDSWEMRGMALNAILDLATPEDHGLLSRLAAYHEELSQRPAGNGLPGSGDPEREALMDDVLATLYRLDTQRYGEAFLDHLEAAKDGRVWPPMTPREVAAVALRAGRYEDAIRLYERQLASSQERAYDHYNLACAYASWSLEPDDREAAEHRSTALQHLAQAVAAQWTDIDWMEQDRDLDPIRDTPEYAALKARIETLIGGDQAPPRPPERAGRRFR